MFFSFLANALSNSFAQLYGGVGDGGQSSVNLCKTFMAETTYLEIIGLFWTIGTNGLVWTLRNYRYSMTFGNLWFSLDIWK